jgi:hypothetical protein
MELELIVYGVVALCILLVIFVAIKSKTKKKKLPDFAKKKIKKELKKIESLSPEEQVMQLDKLLDFLLSNLGKEGSLGEKLKKSELLLDDINSVWSAHKLRNMIAHEVGFKLSKKDYKFAMRVFKKVFKDFGI